MKSVQRIAKLFVASVRKSGIPVSSAYLFGSYATGAAAQFSDIDICIISPDLGEDPIGEMVRLRDISYPIDARIEPISLNPSDFNDPYSTLVAEIKRNGKRIFA